MRNGSVDYLRFTGACGIILFHMSLPWAWLGLAALPMFVTLLVHYGAHRPLSYHIRRLMLPWAIWSMIYGLAKAAQALVENKPIFSEFRPWMILTGPSIHLWFLPFCIIFLVVFRPIWRAMPPMIWIAVSTAVSIGAIWAMNTVVMPIPLPQWLSVLPAACLGFVITGEKNNSVSIIVFCIVIAALIFLGWSSSTWHLLLSSSAILICFRFRLPSTDFSKELSSLSLGMYLIHPLITTSLGYVIPLTSFLSFGIVIAASVLGTLIMRRLIPQAA